GSLFSSFTRPAAAPPSYECLPEVLIAFWRRCDGGRHCARIGGLFARLGQSSPQKSRDQESGQLCFLAWRDQHLWSGACFLRVPVASSVDWGDCVRGRRTGPCCELLLLRCFEAWRGVGHARHHGRLLSRRHGVVRIAAAEERNEQHATDGLRSYDARRLCDVLFREIATEENPSPRAARVGDFWSR